MKNAIRIGIFVIVAAALIVGYYFYLSHGRTTKEETPAKKTELEKVLTVDFVKNYPETPREVMKWYNRIIKLYYDSETEDTMVDALCDQAMMLLDDELVSNNPRDNYIASVRADIADYKQRSRKIVSTEVCDTNDVVYKKRRGDSMAYVQTHYFIAEGSDYENTYQKYALRKDDNGRWKILAFQLTDEDGNTVSALPVFGETAAAAA